ncbi:hypothetical protein T5B8_02565 [Salinisphaera sp. T5B8]
MLLSLFVLVDVSAPLDVLELLVLALPEPELPVDDEALRRLRVVVDFFAPVFAVLPVLLAVLRFLAVDEVPALARLLVLERLLLALVVDLVELLRFLAVLFALLGAALSALAAASAVADSALSAAVLVLALAVLAA